MDFARLASGFGCLHPLGRAAAAASRPPPKACSPPLTRRLRVPGRRLAERSQGESHQITVVWLWRAARTCIRISLPHHLVMSSAAVREVIALATELTEEERSVVIDAIAPRESIANLASEWESEIAHRARQVREGRSRGKPADEVFDRLEAQLKAR